MFKHIDMVGSPGINLQDGHQLSQVAWRVVFDGLPVCGRELSAQLATEILVMAVKYQFMPRVKVGQ